MKKGMSPIWALWTLITVGLIIFIGLSLGPDIRLGNHTLTKARFAETLLAREEEADSVAVQIELPDTVAIVAEPIEPDTTVHSVLVFGDSMTHHLAMSIAKYGSQNNYKVTGVTWESSSIPGWSSSGKIKQYMEMAKPDFIFISLGSNEMELKYFDKRIPDIKKILEQIDTIPYVWVGPPLWKEDKGVYAMLDKAINPEKVFHTVGIEIPRGGDHIHPTRKGADVWADTLMRWIANSPHPILNQKPDSSATTKGHKFIYLHSND